MSGAGCYFLMQRLLNKEKAYLDTFKSRQDQGASFRKAISRVYQFCLQNVSQEDQMKSMTSMEDQENIATILM